jgi:hypothetical protein
MAITSANSIAEDPFFSSILRTKTQVPPPAGERRPGPGEMLETMPVPHLMEFIFSDRYLDRGKRGRSIYPRQATLLKCIFLGGADPKDKEKGHNLFTQYDREVIGEWQQSFANTGDNGIVPDLYQRINLCLLEGRPWFRETEANMGRRGSKGYMGAVAGSYVLWNYLSLGDPQSWFGIDQDKPLTAMVFAAKKEDAKANQWLDLVSIITAGPCFGPFISKPQAERMTVYAMADWNKQRLLEMRGINIERDLASFNIQPKESTGTAGRGPASFMQFYDEGAWMKAPGDMTTIYSAATPALDQFGVYGFIYVPSSPAQKVGRFYEIYEQSLEEDEETGLPAYPEILMWQLASWDVYKDWERTGPGGIKVWEEQNITERRYFPMFTQAIQAFDAQMMRLQRANPETFRVERLAHFAAVLDAYLSEKRIKEMFDPWKGKPLAESSQGILNRGYHAHGDPGAVNANFGFAIGHLEAPPEDHPLQGVPHVVFDIVHTWRPGDFPDNDFEIDYLDTVVPEINEWVDAFHPSTLTFDQWNAVMALQTIRKHVRGRSRPKRIDVAEISATRELNWQIAETFKAAINLNLVHVPDCDGSQQMALEATYLQDTGGKVEPSDEGPVETKDTWDAVSRVVHRLLGVQLEAILGELGGMPMQIYAPGGIDPFPEMREQGGMPPSTDPKHAQLSKFGQTVGSPARSTGGFTPYGVRDRPPPTRRPRPGRGRLS